MIKPFVRWIEREAVALSVLYQAVQELEKGLFDANLGGGLYKKRIPHSGRGKRGGARTIIATRLKGAFFFLIGFAKNERENITSRELRALRDYANYLLDLSENEIDRALAQKELKEVNYDESNPERDS